MHILTYMLFLNWQDILWCPLSRALMVKCNKPLMHKRKFNSVHKKKDMWKVYLKLWQGLRVDSRFVKIPRAQLLKSNFTLKRIKPPQTGRPTHLRRFDITWILQELKPSSETLNHIPCIYLRSYANFKISYKKTLFRPILKTHFNPQQQQANKSSKSKSDRDLATEYLAVEADAHLCRVELICVNSEATVSAGESTVATAERGTCALHASFLLCTQIFHPTTDCW